MERACNGIDMVEAELYIDEALRLFPEDGYFLKYQGELLWMKGKCADALEVFADAREKTNNGITQLELDKFLNPYGSEDLSAASGCWTEGWGDEAYGFVVQTSAGESFCAGILLSDPCKCCEKAF